MKAKQLYVALIAALCLLFCGFFAVGYATNKVLSAQATKLSKLKADNEAASARQTSLAKNIQDIKKYQNLSDIAQGIVPQDKDQAETVRQIVKLAGESGITQLSSVTFPSSTLGANTPGAASKTKLSQLTPVKGMTGVYELPITVAQDSAHAISYDRFLTFLSKLESNRRTAQISNIVIQPDAQNPSSIAFTIVINEYIKP